MAIEDIIKEGNAFLEKGDMESALEKFNLALDLDKDNIEALRGIGNIFYFYGHYASAIKTYNSILQLNENEYDCYYKIAFAYLSIGNFPYMEKVLSKYLGLQKHDFLASCYYAFSLVFQREQDKSNIIDADAIFTEILSSPNVDKAIIYLAKLGKGIIANAQQRPDEAKCYFDETINTEKKLTEANKNFFYIYAVGMWLTGNSREALASIERILDQCPCSLGSLILKARIFMKEGLLEQAKNVFERILDISPNNLDVQRIMRSYGLQVSQKLSPITGSPVEKNGSEDAKALISARASTLLHTPPTERRAMPSESQADRLMHHGIYAVENKHVTFATDIPEGASVVRRTTRPIPRSLQPLTTTSLPNTIANTPHAVICCVIL